MMTNSEIRALLADCEDEYHLLGRNTGLNVPKLRTALETLLAREAEVLAAIGPKTKPFCDQCEGFREFDEEYCCTECGTTDEYMELTDIIRAIIHPQPAALAEENDEWKLMPTT